MLVRCDRELISRYKDGEVTPQERRALEAHLASCPDCAATLAAYRDIGRSIASLQNLRAPSSLRSGVYARVAQQNSRARWGNPFGTLLSGLALAGTAVILILVLSVFFKGADDTATLALATAVYPPPEAADIPPATTIEVQFNKPMDAKSVEGSLAITPTVDASIAWEGEKLVVKPKPGLAANTSYTVTIGNLAKTAQGAPLKEPVVLHFTTGSEDMPTRTVTPGLTAVASPATPSPISTASPTPGSGTPTPIATPSPITTPVSSLAWPRLVVVDPKSSSTLFLATSGNALYKSTNGGASWRALGPGLPAESYVINSLLIDPQISQVLYLGTSQGAYRSGDGGDTWSPINNGLPSTAPSGKPNIQSLVMNPANHLILYAGLPSGTTPATIYRSTDAGASWTPLSSMTMEGTARPLGPTSLLFYPDLPSTLFASTSAGVFQSLDAGATWTAANKNLAEAVTSLVLDPKDRTTLYAIAASGVYKTARGSIDWQKLSANVSTLTLRGLSLAPDGALYAATSASDGSGRRSTALRSTDGGSSWSQIQGGLENTEPQAFIFDPANPRTIYGATLAGLFKSTDGGSRWTQVSLTLPPTPTPQPEVTISGVISETLSDSLAIRVLSDDKEVWQIALNQDAQQPTQIVFADGKPALFADLKPQSRVVAQGRIDPQAKSEKTMIARVLTLGSAQPTPTASPVSTPGSNAGGRIAYVYDSSVGSSYTGDWATHLKSRGFSVTSLDARSDSGFDLSGYDLIVVGWMSGQELPANLAKIQSAKAPVLNGYTKLVDSLGQGKVYDSGNPGRTVYGKTITIEGTASTLTSGYSGEVVVANDTLYRVPIIASGTVLASVTDDQQGVRSAPVWTLADNKVYFGFWYSKDGTNENEAYWTFFDRSVDYLLGRGQQVQPAPTPVK